MSAKYVQKGDCLDYTPATDVNAGDIVVAGAIFGVVQRPIAAGEIGAIATTGVFELSKATTDAAMAFGDIAFWDASNAKVVATAGTNDVNVPCGVVVAEAAAAAETVLVKIG